MPLCEQLYILQEKNERSEFKVRGKILIIKMMAFMVNSRCV